MKKIIPFFIFSFLASFALADEVRIYTDYSPVRILKLVEGTDFELEASKAGLKGAFKLMDESSLPKERDDRAFWKVKSGKIVIDQALKAEEESKSQVRESALSKLKATGLTDEELKSIGIGG